MSNQNLFLFHILTIVLALTHSTGVFTGGSSALYYL